jgi:hypothetical protein
MRILKHIIKDKLDLLAIGALSLQQYKMQMIAIRITYQIGGK